MSSAEYYVESYHIGIFSSFFDFQSLLFPVCFLVRDGKEKVWLGGKLGENWEE